MDRKRELLKQYFGYDGFRRGQEELIDAVLSGRDAFGIMPTGGGKSICYQIPALIFPGVTLVISPLISLMKDQVTALTDAGVPAAFLNSSLTLEQQKRVFRGISCGTYKIVYVAPERLETDGFMESVAEMPISFLAVDEAHCISQWGQDFRPSYLKIADFIRTLPYRPTVAAFTATATDLVKDDIIRVLGLKDPYTVVTGFDRPNLNFEVTISGSKRETLLSILASRSNVSGIVYCPTRSKVETVCEFLNQNGYSATRYHAGLDDSERKQNQEDFIYDRKQIMVATNAFGMGIDKSNVRFVVHFGMPKSPEEYYQEAGRAGRDGEPADCILIFSSSDIYTALKLINTFDENSPLDEEERKKLFLQNRKRLDYMIAYCRSVKCLRGALLSYFGEEHPERCESCGNCHTVFCEEDITVHSQMILSCIKRIFDKLGYAMGRGMICDVLRGSESKKIYRLGLENVSTYGIMKGVSRSRVIDIIEYLECEGFIFTDPEHGGVTLTQSAREVLFGGRRLVTAFKDPVKTKAKREKKRRGGDGYAQGGDTPFQSADEMLFEKLRKLRFEIAKEEGIPAYVVFHDSTLREMAIKKPSDNYELSEVSGVGMLKIRKYGEKFLAAIAECVEQNGGLIE